MLGEDNSLSSHGRSRDPVSSLTTQEYSSFYTTSIISFLDVNWSHDWLRYSFNQVWGSSKLNPSLNWGNSSQMRLIIPLTLHMDSITDHLHLAMLVFYSQWFEEKKNFTGVQHHLVQCWEEHDFFSKPLNVVVALNPFQEDAPNPWAPSLSYV